MRTLLLALVATLALPLALAANRLTEARGRLCGPPLLARERCRSVLLNALEALP
jgi:hypothetical protein